MADANRIRVCVRCKSDFEVRKPTSTKLFCSTKCIGEAARRVGRNYNGQLRERTCLRCQKNFSYEVRRGTDRNYCSPQCAAYAQTEIRKSRLRAVLGKCSSEWCSKPATRKQSNLCERCYISARRNGGIPRQRRRGRGLYECSSGYIVLIRPGHPLGTKEGHIREHRYVAYEKHGGACPPCYWCGTELDWQAAVIDHLNEHKYDNRPENLVVACSACNRSRGIIPSFIRKMLPERYAEFIDVTCHAHIPKQ